MNNFILSIDPSIKETGFILWEKDYCNGCDTKGIKCTLNKWQPIWASTYNFKKYNFDSFVEKIYQPPFLDKELNISLGCDDISCYIERGFHMQNRNTTEMLDCLRGNIFGLFNKLYEPKEHGISPKEWQNWYKFEHPTIFEKSWKWTKEVSINCANYLIKKYGWNINIKNNHNLSDALLLGWYAINNRLEQE